MNDKERIRAVLNRKPNVIFAYLFGSRVKGYATKESDWDLAVCLDSGTHEHDWFLFELEAELSREIGANVQVTDLNQSLTPLFGFQIVRDGEEVINKDEAKRLEVTSLILRRYFDWSYYEQRHIASRKR